MGETCALSDFKNINGDLVFCSFPPKHKTKVEKKVWKATFYSVECSMSKISRHFYYSYKQRRGHLSIIHMFFCHNSFPMTGWTRHSGRNHTKSLHRNCYHCITGIVLPSIYMGEVERQQGKINGRLNVEKIRWSQMCVHSHEFPAMLCICGETETVPTSKKVSTCSENLHRSLRQLSTGEVQILCDDIHWISSWCRN